jgi:N-terminal domain of galactosyltransferase
MHEATVCIPWRPAADRMDAYARVTSFWKHHGFPIVEADSTPALAFSISESRNRAVRQAETEIVIVADADTIPDIGAIAHALERSDGVTWPFTEYRHVAAGYVDQADLMTAPPDKTYRNSVGGIFICRRDTYWRLGGMDERFERRWGYEDNAFHAVASTLATVRREPGIVFSFNHAVDGGRDLTTDNPNRWRHELYKYATGKPQLMAELIKR